MTEESDGNDPRFAPKDQDAPGKSKNQEVVRNAEESSVEPASATPPADQSDRVDAFRDGIAKTDKSKLARTLLDPDELKKRENQTAGKKHDSVGDSAVRESAQNVEAESTKTQESAPVSAQDVLRAEMSKMSKDKLARTKLDPDEMRKTVSKSISQTEIKVAELIEARANEPPKPFHPIENYRAASPCSVRWEGTDPKERVRICQSCKLQVYDFTGLEQPEADELILQRENRQNAPLFKRADGKFLTSDCPLALKKKREQMLSIGGGVVLLVILLVWLILSPKPAPNVVTQSPSSQEQAVGSDADDHSADGAASSTSGQPASLVVPSEHPVQDDDGGYSWSTYVKQAKDSVQQDAKEAAASPNQSPTPDAVVHKTAPDANAGASGSATDSSPVQAPNAGSVSQQQGEPASADQPGVPAPQGEQAAPSQHGVQYFGTESPRAK